MVIRTALARASTLVRFKPLKAPKMRDRRAPLRYLYSMEAMLNIPTLARASSAHA